MIQDNASYHKKPEVWDWFKAHRRQVEVLLLPPYSPEFNATERLWHHTRKQSTHNRFFDQPEELCRSLFATFRDMEKHPENILGFLNRILDARYVVLLIRGHIVHLGYPFGRAWEAHSSRADAFSMPPKHCQ